jgi:hypothetical protein
MDEINQNIDRIGIIDSSVKKLIKHEIKIPYLDHYNSLSDYWYPHPPCFIPLFLGYGASYKGLIHHFFCDRKDTFAEYSIENGFITEIARSSKQWITLIVLEMIMLKEGLNKDIINFCQQIVYSDYEAVDEFTLDYGDDPKEFKNLVHLQENTPSKYTLDVSEYNGDFPSTLSAINPAQIENGSIFEIAVPEKLGEINNLPLWLNNAEDKPTLFDDYLNKNMLKEAWFTLNSKGWKLKDVATALEGLVLKTDNELFHIVAKNWINQWKKSNDPAASY